MIDGLAPLNERLQRKLTDYQVTKGLLLAEVARVQDTCPHMQVLEAPGRANVFGDLKPLRMCACCRLEEESVAGIYGPWSTRGYQAVLGNEPHRLVVKTTRDEIYALRLPGPRNLANEKYGEKKDADD